MPRQRRFLLGRRNAIKTAAAGLGFLTVPTFADTGRANTEDKFALVNGKLVYLPSGSDERTTVRIDSASELESEDLSANQEIVINEVDKQKVVAGLNEARQQGLVRFNQEDDQVLVFPTNESLSERNDSDGDVSILHHGLNKYETDLTWRGLRHSLYMDDYLTREVHNAMTIGSGITGVATKISSATVGGIPVSVVTGILTVLQITGIALLVNNNNGHGVRIRAYQPVTYLSVQPQ